MKEDIMKDAGKIGEVFYPVLLYYLISFAAAFFVMRCLPAELLSEPARSAASVTLGALCSLIPFAGMLRRDCGKDGVPVSSLTALRPSDFLLFFAGVFISCLSAFVIRRFGWDETGAESVQQVLLHSPLFWQIAGPGLLVPAAEEVLYRGLVYGRVRRTLPPAAAVLLTAVLFALGHGGILQIVYAFLCGLLLGAARERSGRLTAPLLFHIGANLTSIVFTRCITH